MSDLRDLVTTILGEDAWKESDHPRVASGEKAGQFTAGAGGGSVSSSSKPGGVKGLKEHPTSRMRDYTPKELDWEYNVEYGKYSKHFAPNAFKDRADFQKKFDAAPLRHLTDSEMRSLRNTSGLASMVDHPASAAEKEKYLRKQIGTRRDVDRIYRDLDDPKHATAPPIILKKDGALRLMAGNTRLMAAASRGLNLPVKVIDVSEKPTAKDEQVDNRRTRDAFVYMEPRPGQEDDFAQCGPCRMFVPASYLKDKTSDRCIVHGSFVSLDANDSCGVFTPWPTPDGQPNEETVKDHARELDKGITGSVTPIESGLVSRRVQCHRCNAANETVTRCHLYEDLNKQFPERWNLDPNIKRHACCNAQEPKE